MSLGTVISLCDESGNMVLPWAEAGYECWCFDIKTPIRVPRRVGNINFVWGDARTVRRPPGNIVAAFAYQLATQKRLKVALLDWDRYTPAERALLKDAVETARRTRSRLSGYEEPLPFPGRNAFA